MIKGINLSEIYNSCKEKTVKVFIKTDKGIFSASSPSGTSTGKHEAKTLNVDKIKKIFPNIKKKFIGKEESRVDEIIEEFGLERMGANLSIALSMAAMKAVTNNNPYKFFNKTESFPYPLGNVIGGGAHGGYLSEQEFLILPVKAKTIKEAVEMNLSIWKSIGLILKPFLIGRNKESAWMCKLNDLKSLEMLSNVAEDFGARIGIDFAANNIYNGRYYYKHPDRNFTADQQLDFILELIKAYRLVYIEDPFQENDFEHLAELTKKARCLVTGDDFFVTSSSRLKLGIKKKAGNAIIIKPNQSGTILRTLETVDLAKKSRYTTIVSHRSCETEESFIADLAVGIKAPIIKCGIYGNEREAKFKRLEDIWKKTQRPKMATLNL